MKLLQKVWKHRNILRSLPQSIYFNFYYLPFYQAIRFPILLYKPDLLKMKGKVRIECDNVHMGMIRLGFRTCSIYPNNGVVWENKGGEIVFKGICRIGNDSSLSFGEKTTVMFGNDFRNTASLKLVSYKGIIFGNHVSLGWECLIMDTNFHSLYDMKRQVYKKNSGEIKIGDYNWFGTHCKIMHSVRTPERCIFGMNTVVTRNCEAKSYCLMGGSPVKILSENVMRDYEHDVELF